MYVYVYMYIYIYIYIYPIQWGNPPIYPPICYCFNGEIPRNHPDLDPGRGAGAQHRPWR